MKNEKMTNFIAKDVIAIDNGQNIGYVLDCCFDANLTKLVGLVVADEESEKENYLPVKDIQTIGEDCIIVESAYKLEPNYLGYSNNPINKTVVDDKGQFLGKVFDVELEKFKVTKLLTERCEILPKNIYSCGVDCLFFGNKKRRKNSGVKIIKSQENLFQKVETQNINLSNENTQNNSFKIAGATNKAIIVPSKLTLAPSSLLNKKATVDIFGYNNELIIREGQVINQAKIDKAKKHNKLNLLIINSK